MTHYWLAETLLELEGVTIERKTEQHLYLINKHGVRETIANTGEAIIDYLLA